MVGLIKLESTYEYACNFGFCFGMQSHLRRNHKDPFCSPQKWFNTVNSEIFARILFSPVALKHIFAMLKICDKGMIYLYQ